MSSVARFACRIDLNLLVLHSTKSQKTLIHPHSSYLPGLVSLFRLVNFHNEQPFHLLLQCAPQEEVRQIANERKPDPVPDVRNYVLPPTSKGLHNVRGVIVGSWA